MQRLFICYLISTSQKSCVTQVLRTSADYKITPPRNTQITTIQVSIPCHSQMSSIFTSLFSMNFFKLEELLPIPKPASLCHVGLGLGHSWAFSELLFLPQDLSHSGSSCCPPWHRVVSSGGGSDGSPVSLL